MPEYKNQRLQQQPFTSYEHQWHDGRKDDDGILKHQTAMGQAHRQVQTRKDDDGIAKLVKPARHCHVSRVV